MTLFGFFLHYKYKKYGQKHIFRFFWKYLFYTNLCLFPVCFKFFLCICGIKNITFDFIDYNGSLFHTCSVFNRQTSTIITKVALWHFKFIKVAHGRQKVCGSSSDHYYIVSRHRWQSSPRTRVFLAALNLCQSQHWCQTPPPLFYWGVCMRIVLWNRYPLCWVGSVLLLCSYTEVLAGRTTVAVPPPPHPCVTVVFAVFCV